MPKSMNSMSIIVTGSELNHRTFHEDESWNSLQSTILAGNMSSKAEDIMADKLDTVEEEQKVDCSNIDCSNILNVNIDALDDEEVFFDCPNYKSPMIQKNRSFVREKPTPNTNVQPVSTHLLPAATSALPTHTCSSPDSGFDLGDDRTGDMLAKILEDFNQLSSHAQSSTPKHCSEHLSELATTNDNLKKKLNFMEVQKSPDVATKENCLDGKYIKDVDVKPAPPVAALRKTPRPKRRRPRVSEICAFFENVSRTNEQSRSTCSVVRKSAPTPKKLASKRSPTYHTKEMFKILKNKSHKMSYNSSGTASFLLRNHPKPRPSSCSELPSERSGKSSKGQRLLNVSNLAASKSRSMNDLSTVHASKLEATAGPKMRQCTPVRKKSPKKKAQGEKGVSEINKRRSLQGLIRTPVKPVRELRSVFSPKNAPVNDAKIIKQSSNNVALSVNQTRKISDKSQNTVPRIVITKE